MTSIRNILLAAVAAVVLSLGATACENTTTLSERPELVIPDTPRDTAEHIPTNTMGG